MQMQNEKCVGLLQQQQSIPFGIVILYIMVQNFLVLNTYFYSCKMQGKHHLFCTQFYFENTNTNKSTLFVFKYN